MFWLLKTMGETGSEVIITKIKVDESQFIFKNVTCDYCYKSGHIKKYYFRYKRDMEQQKREDNNDYCVVFVANDEFLFVMKMLLILF